jgi:hypothetical protein
MPHFVFFFKKYISIYSWLPQLLSNCHQTPKTDIFITYTIKSIYSSRSHAYERKTFQHIAMSLVYIATIQILGWIPGFINPRILYLQRPEAEIRGDNCCFQQTDQLWT